MRFEPGTRQGARRAPWSVHEMEWDEIDRPGCYLVIVPGHLARIPASAFTPGQVPAVSLVSLSPVRVARLSNDPAESLEVLRAVAAARGYLVSF